MSLFSPCSNSVKQGERTLYIARSETLQELTTVALRHGWYLDRLNVFELAACEMTLYPAGSSPFAMPRGAIFLNRTSWNTCLASCGTRFFEA